MNNKITRPKLIAEIGCNHKGDIEIAKEMIRVAAHICHADAVKFQKRNPRELLSQEQYNAPHPNPIHAYGDTYGAHREFLEFNTEQHLELIECCRENNIEYSTSVWDIRSAQDLIKLDPNFVKIPSASNLYFDMLELLCRQFKGDIHLSLGMTSKAEEQEIVHFFEKYNRIQDLILYSCTSGYPVAFEDICLLEITRLNELYGNRVKAIGFSGHHLGIAADIAALTVGASWIERHFTLDRTWSGTDHAASLEPQGLRKLARDIKNVSLALKYKQSDFLEIEVPQREKLKKLQPPSNGQ